jgi:NitT/TauT family transport system substrate-binding protein
VKLYGNVIIASPSSSRRTRRHQGLPVGLHQGRQGSDGQPGCRHRHVKARDGIVNVPLETRRLQLAIDTVINSPDARAEGFGQAQPGRLSLMASQVSDAFNTKTRVNADDVWNGSFLPSKAELNILPEEVGRGTPPVHASNLIAGGPLDSFVRCWVARSAVDKKCTGAQQPFS